MWKRSQGEDLPLNDVSSLRDDLSLTHITLAYIHTRTHTYIHIHTYKHTKHKCILSCIARNMCTHVRTLRFSNGLAGPLMHNLQTLLAFYS